MSNVVILTNRRAREATSWRRRRKQPQKASPPPQPLPLSPLAGTSTNAFVTQLPQFRQFLAETRSAQALVAFAANAVGSQRIGLHIFLEGVDAALKDMIREVCEVEQGVAQFSVHQPDIHTVRRVAEGACARILAMQQVRKVIVRPADVGFFGNVLAVLDALLLVPPDVEIEVDWSYDNASYKHFTYAPPRRSDCVWKALFKPICGLRRGAASSSSSAATFVSHPAPAEETLVLDGVRFNFLLTSRFRWLFRRSPHNAAQRRAYHDVYARWVTPTHPELVRTMDTLGAELRSQVCVGVHKRVDTPGTVEYQGAKRVFSSEEFIRAVQRLIASIETDATRPQFVTRIFLATDDANAEGAFRRAFGSRLVMRDGVQRVPGGLNADGTLNEVHIASPHNPTCSLSDAVDVVADALLLSCCGWVVHMDSNVTSTVALMNPDVTMLHMVDVECVVAAT